MKLFITDNTLQKLEQMLKENRPDSISVRKRKPTDPDSNVMNKIKLSDEQRAKHKTGMFYNIYISKKQLKKINKYLNDNAELSSDSKANPDIKRGGILPLIPLILGAVGALTGAVSAGTTIAKTVIDKRAAEERLKEEERHNRDMESAARGDGIVKSDGLYLSPFVKDFVNGSGMDDIGKKCLKSILKNLSSHFKIERNGDGLYLSYLK
jgi:hypothetical protein